MKKNWSCAALLAIVALTAGCMNDDDPIEETPSTPAPPTPTLSNAVVLEWNALLTENQGAGNLYSFRQYAMLHIAMFDAANAIRKTYRGYLTEPTAPTTASEEAAAAQAARDVMVALYPAATASFDAALAARIVNIPSTAAAEGVVVGRSAAQSVLTWRANDGAAGPDPAYTQPALPGIWRPTPSTQVPAGGRFQTMIPFGILTGTQFFPTPPPPLNSTQYANSVRQVHDIGGTVSAVRTADQTLVARLIAGVNYRPGPFALWNGIARNYVQSNSLNLVDSARVFALLNAGLHDGIHTSMASKYVYNLWRPINAITNAADDANDATVADPTWTPLITTPAYPSHASNVACFATSAARIMARVAGSDARPFSVTWTWTGAAGAGTDVTRAYTAFSQLSQESGQARIWGGIHFDFEVAAAEASCTRVADFIYDRYALRR